MLVLFQRAALLWFLFLSNFGLLYMNGVLGFLGLCFVLFVLKLVPIARQI